MPRHPHAAPASAIQWSVIVRRYSLKSRRTLRRTLLLARWKGVDVTVDHDRGWIFRQYLLTFTGAPDNLRRFHRTMNRVRTALRQQGRR